MERQKPMPPKRSRFAMVVVISLLAHGLLLGALHNGAHAALPRPPEPVRVSFRALAPKPKAEPTPEPQAEASVPVAKAPAAHPTQRAERSRERSTPSRSAAPATPAAPAALDFTGVTLTGTSNAGFAQVAGNGQPMLGALGASPRSVGSGGSDRGTSQGAGPSVVPLASLKRPPRAPSLENA